MGGAYYRAYAKHFQRAAFLDASGKPAHDEWNATRGGFRLDWETSAQDALRVQGDVHRGNAHQEVAAFSLTPPFERDYHDHATFDAANLLARWERTADERSGLAFQFYYDHTSRAEAINAEQTRTFDAEFQQRRPLGETHDLQWGLEARLMSDYLPPGLLRNFEPERRRHHLFSAYIQEEMRLAADRLRLTLGAKFEHNQYTGLELQPAAQLLWTPHRQHTLWGSLARAVRSPARYERDALINLAAFSGLGGWPVVLRVTGNPEFQSEQMRAHELGYRFQAARRWSLDLAGFWNRYRSVMGAGASALYIESDPAPVHLVVPLVLANQVEGSAYGAEATAVWNVTSRWKLAGGHSWLRLRLRSQALQPLPDETRAQGESPEHLAHLRSNLDLPRQFSLDAALYAVSALSASEGYLARPGVPAYARLDVRLGWKPTRNWDFSVGLQNLLDAAHPEFITPEAFVAPGNQVRRGVYARLTWTF
jgi:iron complex outermembrane receptor protein